MLFTLLTRMIATVQLLVASMISTSSLLLTASLSKPTLGLWGSVAASLGSHPGAPLVGEWLRYTAHTTFSCTSPTWADNINTCADNGALHTRSRAALALTMT